MTKVEQIAWAYGNLALVKAFAVCYAGHEEELWVDSDPIPELYTNVEDAHQAGAVPGLGSILRDRPSADIRGANMMLHLQPAFRTLSGAPILRLE